jgi:hypothetical protein
MVDLTEIKHAVQIINDEHGKPMAVVKVPLAVWEALIAEVEANQPTTEANQRERFEAFLASMADEEDDNNDQWSEEFRQFLKENRLNFPERDLGLGDE